MAPSFDFDCVPNLLCAEDASVVAWDDNDDDIHENANKETCICLHSPDLEGFPDLPAEDDESISFLVEKECDHMPQDGYLQRFQARTLDVSVRQDGLSWILKVHAHYNFGPLTAYLAINYLDRFLSSYQMPQGKAWMLQLLSVSCLSLAAKMEETDVPLLVDFQIEDAKNVFEARTIERMELLILATLKWRLRSITPFSFLHYFVHRAAGDQSPPRSLITRSIELILATIRVIHLVGHRPSAIAAAAVICAAEEFVPLLALDYKRALCRAPEHNKEMIYSCYSVMQDMLIHRIWTSKKKRTSGSLSTPRSPVGVLDAACLSCNSETATSIVSFTSNPSAITGEKRRKLNAFCDTV